jgi:glycosyltransferase involved in cell wall biosynthesis
VIAYAATRHPLDAIAAHTRELAAALEDLGWDVSVVMGRAEFRAALHDSSGGWFVLQYNPFSYGRWGFAPDLLVLPARVRAHGFKFALVVHETYPPADTVRQRIIRRWQRFQLSALARRADQVLVSTEWWNERLLIDAKRSGALLPSGSNLPDQRDARAGIRERLGAGPETVVFACFGTNHPSRRIDLIEEALSVAADEGTVVLLNLGSGAPKIRVPAAISVVEPGRQSSHDLAEHLSACDVLLAPFIDGASLRRGSIAAGMQHGLSVISTLGPSTDSLLMGQLGIVLAGSDAEFVRATLRLTRSASEREESRRAARRLYEEVFAWDGIATRLERALLG